MIFYCVASSMCISTMIPLCVCECDCLVLTSNFVSSRSCVCASHDMLNTLVCVCSFNIFRCVCLCGVGICVTHVDQMVIHVWSKLFHFIRTISFCHSSFSSISLFLSLPFNSSQLVLRRPIMSRFRTIQQSKQLLLLTLTSLLIYFYYLQLK